MRVYRFKLLHEELEEFYRDIEISSEQTFKDFNDIILSSSNLKGNELASFYICEKDWSKINEITLLDMSTENEKNSKNTMSDAILKDFIETSHQRLIYEYDFLNLTTFYIELVKTSEQKNKIKLPRCISGKGNIKANKSLGKEENLQDELLKDFNDLLKDDFYSDSDSILSENDDFY